jgi:ammonia channel protein AmtB
VGGLIGGICTAVFARGSLRRGGTAAGTALLLMLSAVAVFLIALIPVAGYLEALALPIAAARARRRAGEKYAGLRTLAK